MSKSKTTLEADQNQEAGAESSSQVAGRTSGAVPGNWRLLASVGLLLLGVIIGWQAWLLRESQTASAAVEASVEAALPFVQRTMDATLDELNTALSHRDVLAQAAIGTEAGRMQAARALQQLLPQAAKVVVYSSTPDALLAQDGSQLGYERAAELARAQATGQRQVGAIKGKPGEVAQLSVVQPLVVDGSLVGYAALTKPMNAVRRTMHSDINHGGERIDLRLGPDEDAAVLDSIGGADHSRVDVARPVAHTNLWVTGTRAADHALLPDSLPIAVPWILALLALGAALYINWGEQLRGVQQKVRSKRSSGVVDEPTFAQVLQEEAGRNDEGGPVNKAQTAPDTTQGVPEVMVDAGIFRAYDIRGVMGKTLDADVARLLGKAIGSEARDRGQDAIVVGRDGRLSGPELSVALIEGLRSAGIDVIDIGQAPTPLVYFACYQLDTGSGVAVTGSHNPPDYNGFKIVLGGETLAMEAIQGLYQRIVEGRFVRGEGALRKVDVAEDYLDRIAGDVQAQRPLKVVVDCGNGVTGDIGPRVLEEIGCEVTPLFEDIDGEFPNHHPDPSDPENLADLMLAVKHQEADLGLAFDGDGDRLGVVTPSGDIIYPDRLLMLFAADVLIRDPGATIIYDVKCTGHLQQFILRNGGSPLMWKTGHSLIKAKMRETGAALAGEMSGHFFFQERWYGFDDGIYAAARLIEILAGDLDERSPEEIFATLPSGVSTPELKVVTEEGENHEFIDQFCRSAQFGDARITTIDGMRADWSDGWGLVRASNTTPSLVLRFDADNEVALERIKQAFREQIKAVNPDLELPF